MTVAEGKILTITEGRLLDQLGNFKRTRIITYTVRGHGPFQLEIPQSEFDPVDARARIEAKAKEVIDLLGDQ